MADLRQFQLRTVSASQPRESLQKIDYARLGDDLLARADTLLADWFPQGKKLGHEFKVGSLNGEAGASLSINIKTGVWKDFSTGDTGGDLIALYAARLGMSQHDAAMDLSSDAPPTRDSVETPRAAATALPKTRNWLPAAPDQSSHDCAHHAHGKPSCTWPYHDPEGQLIGYVARYDPEGQRKQFCPWTTDAKGWLAKKWIGIQPLYGMDLLAARPGAPVLLVEGEKACDAARLICGEEYVCITWPGGASAYRDADWAALTGRSVLIWPDNDKAGLDAATGICAILARTVEHLATLDVSGMTAKWDAADAVSDGWDRTRFDAWLGEQFSATYPPSDVGVVVTSSDAGGQPNSGATPTDGIGTASDMKVTDEDNMTASLPAPSHTVGRFEFVSAGQLLIPKPVFFLIDEMIETECLAMLFGATGSGKSFLAIGWSCSVATGTPWLDRDVKKGAVFYLAGEGHAGIARRLAAWELHSGHSLETAPLFVSKIPAQLMDIGSAIAVTAEIERLAVEHGSPALIVVDTFARNMGSGDENSNADIAVFVSHIDQMRARLGCVVLLVHHTGHMEGERARGGSALPAAMDCIFRMDSKASCMTVVSIKSKEAELSKPLALALEQFELPDWIDAKGRVMSSAVLVSGVNSAASSGKEMTLSKVQNDALFAFYIAAREQGKLDTSGKFAGLDVEAWRTQVYRASTADSIEAKKKSFQRVRSDLVRLGQVSVDNDIYRLHGFQKILHGSFAASLRNKRVESSIDDDYRDTGHERDIDGTCPGIASL